MSDPVAAAATEPFIVLPGGINVIAFDIIRRHTAPAELIADELMEVQGADLEIATKETILTVSHRDVAIQRFVIAAVQGMIS